MNYINDIKNIDKEDMYNALFEFPKQIQYVLKNFARKKTLKNEYNNILICGMGGSAIGGDLLKTLLEYDNFKLPIFINRSYNIPKWVNNKTLVVLSSYSGNTEETLSCYYECNKKNIKPLILSSDGVLLDEAKKNNLIYYTMPGGYMPRVALGYSVAFLLLIFEDLNKSEIKASTLLEEVVVELNNLSIRYSDIKKTNPSIVFANKIYNKFNLIYTSSCMEVIGLRFRAQLAENSKILASHYILPEQNHNEIEGFEKLYIDNLNIIWINDKSLHQQIKKRFRATSKLLENKINQEIIKFSNGSYYVRIFSLIYFLDWVSFYCSIKNGIDPTPVNIITKLKKTL